MLQDLGTDDGITRDLAVLFKDYTLSLDEPYAEWEKTQTQEDAQAPAETDETVPETTEEVVVEEQTPAENTEKEPAAEEENAPAEQTGKLSKLAAAAPYLRLGVLLIALALLFILLLGQLVSLILHGRKEKDED